MGGGCAANGWPGSRRGGAGTMGRFVGWGGDPHVRDYDVFSHKKFA